MPETTNNHEICLVEVVSELITRNYLCYLEHEIPVGEQRKAIVDIYAVRSKEEVLVEVGFLSQRCKGERLALLRKAKPKAMILHITQLKNFLTQEDWISAYFQHKMKKVEAEEETIG